MLEGYKELSNPKPVAEGPSTREVFNRYIAHWPIFLINLFVCFGIGLLYIYYTVPKYNASTLILVKNETNAGSSSSDELLDNAMSGLGRVNLENELQRLRSRILMERVVVKNKLNLSYFIQGKVRRSDIYLGAPFRLIPQTVLDSNSIELTLTGLTSTSATVSYGPEQSRKKLAVPWNVPFWINGKKLVLVPASERFNENAEYSARWSPVSEAAAEILSKFSVGTSGTKTTIIELSLLIENAERGKDILNGMAVEFRRSNIEELNRIAQNTIHFIDDRLSIVSRELNQVEGDLEKYQGNERAYNLPQQSTQSFKNSDEGSKTLDALYVQESIVKMLKQSLASNDKTSTLSLLGISDMSLSNLVTQYNTLILKRQRDLPNLGEKSFFLEDFENQISDLKTNINQNLESLEAGMQLQQSKLQQQNDQDNQVLASLPHKERLIQEIKREQSIKEGLFLYLLQKREEAAIASTAYSSNYEQIDPATGHGPVEPDKNTILKLSLLIGLALPFALIYLRDLFNDKIISRKDITNRTGVPIVGEISHIKNLKNQTLFNVDESVTGEQFRMIRNNITDLQLEDHRAILVTSASSGEGKSFISLNLGIVIAKAGRKVAVLEFDLRKPYDLNLIVDQKVGLTDYLTGTESLASICQPYDGMANLDIYPAGKQVTNPGDLIVSPKIQSLLATLRSQYDTIIINSAPIGLVGDAFVLGKYCDIQLFVVRQSFTSEKDLEFINDFHRNEKLENISLVFNDVKSGLKYGYQGYGYKNKSAYYNPRLKRQKLPV